jgi:hypothetical protein
MNLKKRTKEEAECFKQLAPIMEKITYDVMLAYFKKQIQQNPTELNKSLYSLMEKKEIWNKIRDVQAQNRIAQMRHTPHTPKP